MKRYEYRVYRWDQWVLLKDDIAAVIQLGYPFRIQGDGTSPYALKGVVDDQVFLDASTGIVLEWWVDANPPWSG